MNKETSNSNLVLKQAALQAFRTWGYRGSLYLEVNPSESGETVVILGDLYKERGGASDCEYKMWEYRMSFWDKSGEICPPGLTESGVNNWFSDKKEEMMLRLLKAIAQDWYEPTVVINTRKVNSLRETILDKWRCQALMRYLACIRQR